MTSDLGASPPRRPDDGGKLAGDSGRRDGAPPCGHTPLEGGREETRRNGGRQVEDLGAQLGHLGGAGRTTEEACSHCREKNQDAPAHELRGM